MEERVLEGRMRERVVGWCDQMSESKRGRERAQVDEGMSTKLIETVKQNRSPLKRQDH